MTDLRFHSRLDDQELRTIKLPEYDWHYRFSAGGTRFMVERGKQPNAFYRWMQTKCLGIIWERVK